MRRWVLALACLAASGAAAQDIASAEATVILYADAVAAGDWATAAALMDPADLARLGELAALIVGDDPITASLLGVRADSSPEDLLAAFVGAAMGANPFMEDAFASISTEVLGTVTEGDRLAHVVARTEVSLLGTPIRSIETTTLLWDGAAWKIGMNAELEGMLVGMKAAMENPELFGMEDDYEEGYYEMDTAWPRDPKKQ